MCLRVAGVWQRGKAGSSPYHTFRFWGEGSRLYMALIQSSDGHFPNVAPAEFSLLQTLPVSPSALLSHGDSFGVPICLLLSSDFIYDKPSLLHRCCFMPYRSFWGESETCSPMLDWFLRLIWCIFTFYNMYQCLLVVTLSPGLLPISRRNRLNTAIWGWTWPSCSSSIRGAYWKQPLPGCRKDDGPQLSAWPPPCRRIKSCFSSCTVQWGP